jgi:hypothetical protein
MSAECTYFPMKTTRIYGVWTFAEMHCMHDSSNGFRDGIRLRLYSFSANVVCSKKQSCFCISFISEDAPIRQQTGCDYLQSFEIRRLLSIGFCNTRDIADIRYVKRCVLEGPVLLCMSFISEDAPIRQQTGCDYLHSFEIRWLLSIGFCNTRDIADILYLCANS